MDHSPCYCSPKRAFFHAAEMELDMEKKAFSSGVILSAMVWTLAEELMDRSLLSRLPIRS